MGKRALEANQRTEKGGPLQWPNLPRRPLAFLRRNLTPQLGAALFLWRLEARLAVPVALALVAAWGRWPAALVMGGIMAVYAALFLYLLHGEHILSELRTWMRGRQTLRRCLSALSGDWEGRRMRQGALVLAAVMLLGPFWRAVAFHFLQVPRWTAYALSVGGSFPHSLLWTGLVLGGLWEGLIWPLLERAGL